MPIYEYRCERGHTFEVMQRMSDDPIGTCTTCSRPVQRVFHPIAVHFKGKGFYNTDYGTRSRQRELARAAEGASGEGASGEASSGEGASGEGSSGKGSSGEVSSGEGSSGKGSSGEGAPAQGGAVAGDGATKSGDGGSGGSKPAAPAAGSKPKSPAGRSRSKHRRSPAPD